MAKARVLHSKLKIDEAGRKHQCQHSRSHIINKGDKRLKVTESRTDEHYCLECAAKFLKGSIDSLQVLLTEVNEALKKPGMPDGKSHRESDVQPDDLIGETSLIE